MQILCFFIEQKQCPFSLQDKTKADSMATKMINKWFLYEAKIFKINWAIKTPRFNGGYLGSFVWSYHVNAVNFRDPAFRESSNLMSVSRLIATVVIDVPIAFDFDDA